ncbi:MAG: hypothetical protein EXR72_07595 [Myxococcales bacterium]|nr:hypothetical protein [Myxococcales bacterium]
MRTVLATLFALCFAAPALAEPHRPAAGGSTASPGSSGTEPPDLETAARDLARDLVDGKYDEVFGHFDPEMQKAVPRERLAAIMEPMRGERAPARSVIVRLRHDHAGGQVTFTIKGNWTRGAVSDIKVTLRPDTTVSGLLITDEAAPLATLDARDRYETKARLRPPFRGTWTALNAGRDDKNPHFGNRNQRFAVDWVILDEQGRSHRGEGKANADYHAWGQEALAPAAATVVLVVDGIPENVPGQKDGYFIPGNHVALDLGQGEYALFMHLVPGSLKVKVGQRVVAGEAIGLVGNSGNSTEPHLHFQLADKPRLHEAAALPAKFHNVILDGKRVDKAWPVEKSRLAPPPQK